MNRIYWRLSHTPVTHTVTPEDPEVQVDSQSGLILPARYIPSPNCDARPAGVEADLIVVHGISLPPDQFGGPWIDQLFTNSLDISFHPYFVGIGALRVSSHLFIGRDASLTQYVRFTERAWHAGPSKFGDREACNDFSIGIELEGSDHIAYEEGQYRALAEAVVALRAAYPRLSPERLVGHSDIAPGRKTDPGPAFDWPYLQRLIGAAS